MKKSYLVIFSLLSFLSFSQKKEINGNLYKNGIYVEEVKTHFQDMVFKTIIHRNVRLGESPSFGETIIIHDASSKGAINYLNLASEIIKKNEEVTAEAESDEK